MDGTNRRLDIVEYQLTWRHQNEAQREKMLKEIVRASVACVTV